MAFSKEMKLELDRAFKCSLENVSELDAPVLVVLDYSPSNDLPPISIAFDYNGGPKCWLSVTQVYERGGHKPNGHSEYREFVFEGRRFYPYSIQAFPKSIFECIEQFEDTCRSLYRHAVQG